MSVAIYTCGDAHDADKQGLFVSLMFCDLLWILFKSSKLPITCVALPLLRITVFPIILFAVISAPSDIKKHEQKDDNLPVDIKLPVKHVLSKELQVSKLLSHCKLSCLLSFSSFTLALYFLTAVF